MIILNIPQKTDQWFIERAKRPTASNFHKIITAGGEKSKSWKSYALELCCSRLVPPAMMRTFYGNIHTERGEELEAEARDEFRRIMKLDVDEVGFVTTDDGGKGCSPDGLIPISGVYKAGLEIKCTVPVIHAARLLANTLPSDHKQQVHGGMDVTGLDYWYFMNYCPGFPSLILRVDRDGYTKLLGNCADDFIIYYAGELKKNMPILRGMTAA